VLGWREIKPLRNKYEREELTGMEKVWILGQSLSFGAGLDL
jgi:hypothetical protein